MGLSSVGHMSAQEDMAKKIRVLIVDDSALIRQFLSHLLSQDRNIEVVGVAR
jgi:two-component system chemotaxis response regulator CheB